MRTQVEQWDPSQILVPFKLPAQTEAFVFGPNLTILKGRALGQKTSDKKMYPYNSGAGDGTEVFKAFNKFTLKTDANGLVYYAPTAVADARQGPWTTSAGYISGTFSQDDVLSDDAVAQVDTFTPATIEVGDIFRLTLTDPHGGTHVISFTATATTAANVSAGIIAAWNASTDPYISRITASGTVTVILTADVAGQGFTVASSTVDGGGANTQTFARVATQANVGKTFTGIIADAKGRILADNSIYIP